MKSDVSKNEQRRLACCLWFRLPHPPYRRGAVAANQASRSALSANARSTWASIAAYTNCRARGHGCEVERGACIVVYTPVAARVAVSSNPTPASSCPSQHQARRDTACPAPCPCEARCSWQPCSLAVHCARSQLLPTQRNVQQWRGETRRVSDIQMLTSKPQEPTCSHLCQTCVVCASAGPATGSLAARLCRARWHHRRNAACLGHHLLQSPQSQGHAWCCR